MATYSENIAKIRGEAVYGPEMREAIAQAIEQADDEVSVLLKTVRNLVNNRELFVEISNINGDDWLVEVINAS